MKIKILEFKFLDNGRPLKAFVDVEVNGWVIREFRVVQQNGQRAFVSPPQVSWKNPETGEIKYKTVLTIPPGQKQRIDTEILHAYQKELEKKNVHK